LPACSGKRIYSGLALYRPASRIAAPRATCLRRTGLNRSPTPTPRHGCATASAARPSRTPLREPTPAPTTTPRAAPAPRLRHRPHQAPVCGGADDPGNMQWQTVAEGKAKDTWERDGCQVPGRPADRAGAGRDYGAGADVGGYGPSEVHVGPRGGRFVYTESGRKRYLGW
jgi:hypothetical protein